MGRHTARQLLSIGITAKELRDILKIYPNDMLEKVILATYAGRHVKAHTAISELNEMLQDPEIEDTFVFKSQTKIAYVKLPKNRASKAKKHHHKHTEYIPQKFGPVLRFLKQLPNDHEVFKRHGL